MIVAVVVLVVEAVADTSGRQPKAQPMERRAVRGFTVELQSVEAHFGRRPIPLGSSRQCAHNRLGPPTSSRLARDSVNTATIGGYECRPPFRISDAVLDLVDQPVQRSVAAVGHAVG